MTKCLQINKLLTIMTLNIAQKTPSSLAAAKYAKFSITPGTSLEIALTLSRRLIHRTNLCHLHVPGTTRYLIAARLNWIQWRTLLQSRTRDRTIQTLLSKIPTCTTVIRARGGRGETGLRFVFSHPWRWALSTTCNKRLRSTKSSICIVLLLLTGSEDDENNARYDGAEDRNAANNTSNNGAYRRGCFGLGRRCRRSVC